MALYVKDQVKVWVSTDSNYKQMLLERSDDTAVKRERTDVNVFSSGYAVLTNTGATNTVTISAGDITSVLSFYIESSNTVTYNMNTGANGMVNFIIQPTTNGTAKLLADCNVASSGTTITVANKGTDDAVSVYWMLMGV